ncbi:hypothetical protein TCDM_12135 [Trypanosoma cruzi Dm28c]|uniref:Uncharacterized protein n=1 Tax=Trypanosoma cruzi Dm28c TaxID=1416333 RepID=V5B307_TRYCR|nr:hypothetical protein TCDM_12135 [Trypanosoma cruzi Dm28c]
MHSRHPLRSSSHRQHHKQRHTHSRNGPAPHTVPAARTRIHRRPHPPTHTSINRAVVVCRDRPVDHNSCLANLFLQIANPVKQFRYFVIPLLLNLILRVIPNTLKR